MKTNLILRAQSAVRDVRFISENDPGYRGHCRHAREARQAVSVTALTISECTPVATSTTHAIVAMQNPDGTALVNPCRLNINAATEGPDQIALLRRPSRSCIGRMVEKAVRRLLGSCVKLEPGRVVTWRERNHTGAYETRYQEVNALWRSEQDIVVLYEVKFTSFERMRLQVGRRQLERTARAAKAHPQVNTVSTRLVYIGATMDRLLTEAVGLCSDDAGPEFGVIWFSPEQIEWAARDLGMDLPSNWRSNNPGCGETSYALAV